MLSLSNRRAQWVAEPLFVGPLISRMVQQLLSQIVLARYQHSRLSRGKATDAAGHLEDRVFIPSVAQAAPPIAKQADAGAHSSYLVVMLASCVIIACTCCSESLAPSISESVLGNCADPCYPCNQPDHRLAFDAALHQDDSACAKP